LHGERGSDVDFASEGPGERGSDVDFERTGLEERDFVARSTNVRCSVAEMTSKSIIGLEDSGLDLTEPVSGANASGNDLHCSPLAF